MPIKNKTNDKFIFLYIKKKMWFINVLLVNAESVFYLYVSLHICIYIYINISIYFLEDFFEDFFDESHVV